MPAKRRASPSLWPSRARSAPATWPRPSRRISGDKPFDARSSIVESRHRSAASLPQAGSVRPSKPREGFEPSRPGKRAPPFSKPAISGFDKPWRRGEDAPLAAARKPSRGSARAATAPGARRSFGIKPPSAASRRLATSRARGSADRPPLAASRVSLESVPRGRHFGEARPTAASDDVRRARPSADRGAASSAVERGTAMRPRATSSAAYARPPRGRAASRSDSDLHAQADAA